MGAVLGKVAEFITAITLGIRAVAAKVFCLATNKTLSARYWGELRPDSPTYARFPNLLYTADLIFFPAL